MGTKWVFFARQFLGWGTYEHASHIGHKIFQSIPHRVAKFRDNRPRDVEKAVVGNKKEITRQKHNSLPLSLRGRVIISSPENEEDGFKIYSSKLFCHILRRSTGSAKETRQSFCPTTRDI